MTPQEKAEELVKKFTAHAHGEDGDQNWINAKLSALIAFDEIIDVLINQVKTAIRHEYYFEVKKEIENL